VSPFIYETAVRPSPDLIEVDHYAPLPVQIEGNDTTAWIRLIAGPA
jgi:hypothetical protein